MSCAELTALGLVTMGEAVAHYLFNDKSARQTSIILNTCTTQTISVPQLAKKFPIFYGTHGPLQRSQQPTMCRYPQPD